MQGAMHLINYMSSVSSFDSCGMLTNVEPQPDQQAHRLIMPHCTTTTMAMLARAQTVFLNDTAMNSHCSASIFPHVNEADHT
jgi:hypothetical protein